MTRTQSNLFNAIEKFIKNYADETERNGMVNILLDLAANVEKVNEKNEELELELKNYRSFIEDYRIKVETLRRTIKSLVYSITEE